MYRIKFKNSSCYYGSVVIDNMPFEEAKKRLKSIGDNWWHGKIEWVNDREFIHTHPSDSLPTTYYIEEYELGSGDYFTTKKEYQEHQLKRRLQQS